MIAFAPLAGVLVAVSVGGVGVLAYLLPGEKGTRPRFPRRTAK